MWKTEVGEEKEEENWGIYLKEQSEELRAVSVVFKLAPGANLLH